MFPMQNLQGLWRRIKRRTENRNMARHFVPLRELSQERLIALRNAKHLVCCSCEVVVVDSTFEDQHKL